MRRDELIKRLDEHLSAGRQVERFLMRSVYVDSIITSLSTAVLAIGKGFDGKDRSLVAEMSNPDTSKFFNQAVGMKLSDRIKVIKDFKPVQFLTKQQAEVLYVWKDKYRDEIFHKFGEFMLMNNLEEKCKKGNEYLDKITNSAWFKTLEESHIKTEEWSHKIEKR